ncbi:sugar transferase [Sulfitobacter sp. SK012]|nr:sugar transferase [Sulfitobacter sp. SK012]
MARQPSSRAEAIAITDSGRSFGSSQKMIWGITPTEKTTSSAGFYRNGGKRIFDTLVILLSVPFSLTIIGLCALALWIEGGNPFYRQDRLGRNGTRFSLLKMRTMVRDADQVLEDYLATDPEMRREWDELQKLRNDPRVTRVGRILRATSLDELPQLWNVLRGDMSLVGPRPMMPEQLEMYGEPSDYFALRPGITGYWQISARNNNKFSFRNEVDADYNTSMSWTKDLAVMVKTIGVMMKRTGC